VGTRIGKRVAGKGIKELKGLFGGLFVANKNLRGMEAHVDKAGSLLHELTAENEKEVSVVTSFILLHFGGLSDHLGGGMMNI